MYKVSSIILILIFSLIENAFAQQINITGKVVNSTTMYPVESADIIVYNNGNIKYKTTSDSTGYFKIPFEYFKGGGIIKIHALNYPDLQINDLPKLDNTLKKDYYLGTFKISHEIIELKEVKINSKKRYSDTTKIDLSNEKFERSIMIDDIFSKSYGFTRDANGQLYYKGKPVTDVTVNGGDFFGKNNLDIYHLLPAMVINKINIVETNIDSVTNTTMQRPAIKVNLLFKDKYNSGKFGNANLGAGTSKRYLANTDLHTYNNKEQVSLSFNSNNINNDDNTLYEPRVNFSSNGNNLTTNSARLAYRNLFADKVEVTFSVKGKIDNKTFESETDIQEKNTDLFSKTYNSARTRTFDINDAKLNINYKIDPLNSVIITQSFNHSNSRDLDTLNYNIKFDSLNTSYQLNRRRTSNTNLLKSKISYQKRFDSKKGRLLSLDVELNNNVFAVKEFSNIYNTANQNISAYFIDGNRNVNENNYSLNLSFTEPTGENGYLVFFLNNEKDKLNYTSKVTSDTTINNTDNPTLLINNFFRAGFKFQETLNKISFDATVTGIFNGRNIDQLQNNNQTNFFNVDFDLKADYKINKKRDFTVQYSAATNYPGIYQLTSLNSSFDLLAQTSGNIFLKPERKQTAKLIYSTRPSDSENLTVAGEFDHYINKFGFNLVTSPNKITENIITNNIGQSKSAQISFSFFKIISTDKYLNYSGGIAYQESPTLINNKLQLDNGITFNQSLSTSIAVVKSLLSVTPLLATSYSKYYYGTSTFTVSTFTYSDKLSLKLNAFQLDLYPLFNYNHSIGNNNSFSMNGGIKKNIFKNYGLIWLQAYDIFNSFKYYNNFVGPSNYQSVKYSNIQRYILLGLSLRFNNIK